MVATQLDSADPLIRVDLEIDCARLPERVQQVRREQRLSVAVEHM
jgi:hypothetical protein